MGESVEEPEEKGTGSHLCLVACPQCTATRQKGGVCHLREGHSGQHECNAVGGEMHSWQCAATRMLQVSVNDELE